ncbi:MAG: 6-phospho-3-hexuloisomerase [Spirochaetia bacterium]
MEVKDFSGASALILGEIERALSAVDPRQADAAVDAICGAQRVFVIGVGRVSLSLSAFAKRLNHLGVPACPVGAIDEPAITERDLLVVGSGSGESIVPVAIARKAKSFGAHVLYIGSNLSSTAAGLADVRLRIPCATKLAREDEIPSSQPMTSLFEQALLLACDALCLLIVARKAIDPASFWRSHANLE